MEKPTFFGVLLAEQTIPGWVEWGVIYDNLLEAFYDGRFSFLRGEIPFSRNYSPNLTRVTPSIPFNSIIVSSSLMAKNTP